MNNQIPKDCKLNFTIQFQAFLLGPGHLKVNKEKEVNKKIKLIRKTKNGLLIKLFNFYSDFDETW